MRVINNNHRLLLAHGLKSNGIHLGGFHRPGESGSCQVVVVLESSDGSSTAQNVGCPLGQSLELRGLPRQMVSMWSLQHGGSSVSEKRRKEKGSRQENGDRHSTSEVKVQYLGLGHPVVWWCQEPTWGHQRMSWIGTVDFGARVE